MFTTYSYVKLFVYFQGIFDQIPKVSHLIVMCDSQTISKKDFPSYIKILSFAEVELIGAEPDNSQFPLLLCPPPLEEEGVYCFAHVSQVCRSVDKPCLINNQRTHSPMIFFLGMVIGYDQQMTSIEFGISRSKVNVTVTLKLRGA